MADTAEVAIESALLARAEAFATAQSLTLSLPNIDFTPPAVGETSKYLRATFLPAEPETLAIGADDDNKHYGFLQIDVFYGLGGGASAPARIAAAAIAYFKRGTRLTRDGIQVDIITTPYRGASVTRQGDPWTMIPVRVPFIAFAPNPA